MRKNIKAMFIGLVLFGGLNLVGCESTSTMDVEEAQDIIESKEQVGVFDQYDATDKEVQEAYDTIDEAVTEAQIEAAINSDESISESIGVDAKREEVNSLYDGVNNKINQSEINQPSEDTVELDEVDQSTGEEYLDTDNDGYISSEEFGSSYEAEESWRCECGRGNLASETCECGKTIND